MKILLCIVACVFLSCPAWSQTAPDDDVIKFHQRLEEVAKKENLVLLFEDNLTQDLASVAINHKSDPNFSLTELLDIAGDIPVDFRRFGRFIAFRRGKFDLPEVVPCITMKEGEQLLRTLLKLYAPLENALDFQTTDTERKRLLTIFNSPQTRTIAITPENRKVDIVEHQEISVRNLTPEQKNLVWQFLLYRYTDDVFPILRKSLNRFVTFGKQDPLFGFMDRSDVMVFGFTPAKDLSPKNLGLQVPLSHPENIVEISAGFGMARFSDNGHDSFPIVDRTRPTTDTQKWLVNRFDSESTDSLIKRANFPSNLVISDVLSDKLFASFGELNQNGEADYKDFGRAFGFIYDEVVNVGTDGLCTVQPKRAKTNVSLMTVQQSVVEAIPRSLLRAIQGFAAVQKTLPEKEGALSFRETEPTSWAAKELRVNAVRRLRAIVEPRIEHAKEHFVPFSQLGREERNLVSVSLLTFPIVKVCSLMEKPIPPYLTDFSKVELIREVTRNQNGKAITLTIGIRNKENVLERHLGSIFYNVE